MKQRWVRLMVLAAVLLCLGGCAFSSPEELYAVPRAPSAPIYTQGFFERVQLWRK